jgi:hypothetical protein
VRHRPCGGSATSTTRAGFSFGLAAFLAALLRAGALGFTRAMAMLICTVTRLCDESVEKYCVATREARKEGVRRRCADEVGGCWREQVCLG